MKNYNEKELNKALKKIWTEGINKATYYPPRIKSKKLSLKKRLKSYDARFNHIESLQHTNA